MVVENAPDAIETLRAVPVFSDLETQVLAKILSVAERRQIGSESLLIQRGDPASDLFIVLRGRFAVMGPSGPIAEISVGEPIGELAFFAGGVRSADVIASRDSEVLAISEDGYREVAGQVAGLERSILSSVAGRLARVTTASPRLRPRPGRLVAIVSVGEAPMSPLFASSFASALGHHPGWQFVQYKGDKAHDPISLLQSCESQGNGAVILSDGAADPAVLERIAANCDTLYVLGSQPDGPDPVAIGAAEHAISRAVLPENRHLIVVRNGPDEPIAHTQAWTAPREFALHHHVALGRDGDFARLSRFVTGNALGVVLCGGGAFGSGHLGAIKALVEHGIAIDMIGGTSAGAAVAGAVAMGLEPERVMDLCEEVFVTSKALKKPTVPLYSVIDHHTLDRSMKEHYGLRRIEDLPLNFFAAATSLTKHDLGILRTGELWRAVRASGSIPALLPPMVSDDGEVFIDGALIDNVPISAMRDLKAGPNLVFNFRQENEWRVRSSYDQLPGRFGAFVRLFVKRKPRFPKVFSILSRTMIVSSRRQLEHISTEGDVVIELVTPHGMGFLDWTKGRRYFERSYREMSAALAVAARASDDPMVQLAMVAEAINASGERDDQVPQ